MHVEERAFPWITCNGLLISWFSATAMAETAFIRSALSRSSDALWSAIAFRTLIGAGSGRPTR